jgi:vacuolar-type H+-ATPase subunit C/Vma6
MVRTILCVDFSKYSYPVSDFRMQLSATDYGNFLANEPTPISTSTISEKATQVLVDQFNYLRSNATEPLSKFLDYLTLACAAATPNAYSSALTVGTHT